MSWTGVSQTHGTNFSADEVRSVLAALTTRQKLIQELRLPLELV